jgi:hypothetical protein
LPDLRERRSELFVTAEDVGSEVREAAKHTCEHQGGQQLEAERDREQAAHETAADCGECGLFGCLAERNHGRPYGRQRQKRSFVAVAPAQSAE